MRTSRIFHPQPLTVGSEIELSEDAVGHLLRVLRVPVGAELILFDGSGYDFSARLVSAGKRDAKAEVLAQYPGLAESPLRIELGQGVSRGDKMDFTIQKAVELGVNTITPLLTERCGVKLDPKRWQKKHQHWLKVIIGACEQCGRATLPTLRPVMAFADWLSEREAALSLNLHPRATKSVSSLPAPEGPVRLLIGPEGGLTEQEIDLAAEHRFTDMLLGPRVLRTETAAMTALAALQARFGDLG